MGKGIVEVAKKGIDAIRDAEENKEEIEITGDPSNGKKKPSFAKTFIFCIVSFIIIVGAWKFFTVKDLKDLLKYMEAFKEYVSAISPLVGILMFLVGASRAVRHTKWSKDL